MGVMEITDPHISIRDRNCIGCKKHNAESMMTIMSTAQAGPHHEFIDVFMSVEGLIELRETIDAFVHDELLKRSRCHEES